MFLSQISKGEIIYSKSCLCLPNYWKKGEVVFILSVDL